MAFKKDISDSDEPYRKGLFGFDVSQMKQMNHTNGRFHAIYFIDYLTGSLLLSNKYTDQSKFCETNEDLIGSFLNALNLFINEINHNEDAEEEIREINFKDSRILYERRGRLMVIGFTKKTNLVIERTILQNLLEDFYGRFEYKINHFNGIIDKEILSYKKNLNNSDLSKFFYKDLDL
ncbi:MAG: hypothetical protein BAJALOKI3v1_510023 [Promethearchaeota archaeon]|nr:MAG: hypothetical protein BAJALOKI3v1_510023 [Candidatus Lokiarchaeota archaeon]